MCWLCGYLQFRKIWNKFTNGIMSENNHIYAKDIKLDAEYTYDKNHNRVYNLKKLRRHFNIILKNLK